MSNNCPPVEPNTVFNIYIFKLNSWKQSYTCNMVSLFTCFQFSMTNQILADADATQSNSIYITTSCDPNTTDCDKVTFKNNNITMKNTVDMSAVQRAYVTNGAQQALYKALQQYGIAAFKFMNEIPHFFNSINNISSGNNTTSTNILNVFFNISVSLNTTIEASCTSNQSNTFSLYIQGYSNVYIDNNNIKQQNDLTMQCSQSALKGSPNVSTNLQTTLETSSSPPEKPLDTNKNRLLFFILSPIILTIVFFLGYATLKSFLPISIVYLVLSLLLIIFYFVSIYSFQKPQSGAWFGFSNSIANCANSNLYTLEETITYTDQKDAVSYCLSKPSYIGFDYKINQELLESNYNSYNINNPIVPGVATFYSGSIHAFDKNQDIIGLTSSNGTNSIQYRNPYYRNASLNGELPSDSIQGDILLDVDSGNLYYRLPLNSFVGQTSTWVKPSKINKWNIDNIYYANQPNPNADVPTQTPIKGPSNELANYSNTKNKVYFYIDITETNIFDGSTLPLPPIGSNYLNPCDQDAAASTTDEIINYNLEVKETDLFVLPYPYAMADNGASYEQYLFSQQFFIYPITADKKPNINSTVKPNLPIGIIPGYSLIPQINTDEYSCTYLKYIQTFPFILWLSVMLFIYSLIGFILYSVQKNTKSDVLSMEIESKTKLIDV